MPVLKISVITVCFNARATITACVESVIAQTHPNIEYIIVDGVSTDGTLDIINSFGNKVTKLISEPDRGIYDAINKGLAIATGDVIGTLNADDRYADFYVLSKVAGAFTEPATDILYGDLDYVDHNNKVKRLWRSGNFKPGMFNRGWMPPHPTFYCRKQLFDRLGGYSLNYGTAADYELMVRFIHRNNINAYYLQHVMVKMMMGGVSNRSLLNRGKALYNDFRAMYNNHVIFPPLALILKPLRKLKQFF
ncbi:glycosyltransferase family 2 protein [Mucilaginibacter sp.]|uniref:glycosyltransferase family 2 protein n=1 Tax=Mucilaginibacter sp. TaxID=1882438 RepID=UPI0035BBC4FC